MKFDYSKTNISETQLQSTMQSLSGYISEIKRSKASFPVHIVNDTKYYEQVDRLVQKMNTATLKWIFLIGIGGSDLGTQAIYSALKGFKNEMVQIRFIDTVSSRLLQAEIDFIKTFVSSTDEFVVNIISKSGTTTEVLANASIILNELGLKFGDSLNKRVVVTTDIDSKLWEVSAIYERLEIPKHIGGRFSVFTAVGMFPLKLAGVDTESLLNGAKEELEMGLEENNANASLVSACIHYIYYKLGIKISNTFVFNKELENLGKWYRQLVAESLGKKHNLDQIEVHEGITPLVSIGTTDLHSQAQLYFGGPRDKLTTILFFNDPHSFLIIPEYNQIQDLSNTVTNKRLDDVMSAIVNGTKRAYETNSLPFISIEFTLLDEYYLGRLMQMKMLEVIFLAKLMNVNAFDQPSVEDYKTETKKLLHN